MPETGPETPGTGGENIPGKTFAFKRNGDILRGLINSIKKRMRLSPAGLSCRVNAAKYLRAERVVCSALIF
jgi:hypothetical protein